MKKYITLLSLYTISISYAQIGIGTNNPAATLEISVNPDTAPTIAPPGFIAPKISGDALKELEDNYKNPQVGAIVFVTSVPSSPLTPKTTDINSLGFYYFNGTKWEKLGTGGGNTNSGIDWFYSPSIVLPTTADSDILGGNYSFSDDKYQVNLYDIYTNQFNNALASSSTPLPIINKENLNYYVSYFDSTVFSDVSITTEGILNYKILPNGIVTEKTFMNIIFSKK